MHNNGIENMRGLCHQGLYHEDKSFINTEKRRMLIANTKVKSKYGEVHLALGHPGHEVMEWHRRNTLNAAYTQEDADLVRPVCEGCVYCGRKERGRG